MILPKCRAMRHLETTTTWTVWLLILVFGISLGSNKEIVDNFMHYGIMAVIIAWAGVAGSVIGAWGIQRFVKNRYHK